MAAGPRPGGLTALAVLNFVFGGLGLIFSALSLATISSQVAAFEMLSKMGGGTVSVPSAGVLYLSSGLGLISSILLLVSGIGYLGQKKMGRTMGNAYGGVAILGTIVAIALARSGFGFGAIIGLIYPVLTLWLINTKFKENLTN